MTIEILSKNGAMRNVEISEDMQRHFSIPINHAYTILNQINSGMYSKWFEGKDDMICLDFGANIGLVSLYMSQFAKKLYCVEPTPSHYNLLGGLLWEERDVCSIRLSNFALTEKEEEVIFMTAHATENKITSADGYGNGKITVQGKPLNWFLDDIGEVVDFCKVDIEGAEIFALTEEELKKSYGKVKCFFVETHPSNNYGMDDCREELIRRFEAARYKTETLDFQTIIAYAD